MIEKDSRKIIGEYVFISKYSQNNDGKKEKWDESIARVMKMHLKHYSEKIKEEDKEEFSSLFTHAWEMYNNKRVLGAQRAFQYGGELMLEKQARLYNCTMSLIDRVSVFRELMYLLLCGCGTGYSVQKRHTQQLPIPRGFNKSQRQEFIIPDTIEGWADAAGLLLENYYYGGPILDFNYNEIRPKGAPIRGGFLAPGHEPLKEALDKIYKILNNISGRRLTPFELHYIICILANSVVTGGVRRSAMISIFDANDEEMLTCKTGNWFVDKPELCRSNNSAVIFPDTPKAVYDKIFESTREFGEPGFVFLNNPDYVVNPCCFIGDTLIAVADGRNAVTIKELAEKGEEFLVYSAKSINNRLGIRWKPEIKKAKAFPTGVKKTVKVTLENGDSFICTPDHRLALYGKNDYIEAKDSVGKYIDKFFTVKNKYRSICSSTNGKSRQYRMIWEYYNGEKPEGYDIDHIDNHGGDFIENLQLITREEHLKKSASEKTGDNNPIFRIKDEGNYKRNLSINSTLSKNSKYNGLSNSDLVVIGRKAVEVYGVCNKANCLKINSKFPRNFSKNRFGGKFANFKEIVLSGKEYVEEVDNREIIYSDNLKKRNENNGIKVVSIEDYSEEMVYDLTVEDNHNFYIITSGDENYQNCEGVLVHNCEVTTLPIYTDENGEKHTGWGFCNLTEINGGAIKTEEEFYEACQAAAVLGTLQAGYTDFKVLTKYSKLIAERDGLIGVGITGLCENPEILFNPEIQKKGAEIVKATNKKVAKMIGINYAARCTVIKPSGNSSQLLGTLSGITPGHSKHYIRHIQAADTEQALKKWEEVNPFMIEKSFWNPKREKVIAFPVTIPEGSLMRNNLSAVDFLKLVLITKHNWIEHGTEFNHPSQKATPDIRMNVSNTCTVKPDEWDEVREFIWNHRAYFGGISLLPSSGDLDYPQAPFTEVLDEKELAERYGAGAILSSGLIVDGMNVFDDIWEACNAALGLSPNLLELKDEEIGDYVTRNIREGHFLVKIDGVHFSDVNCVIDHLRSKIEKRLDWVRRFNSFADKYMGGDKAKTACCLKHVNNYHKWQMICQMKPVDYNDIQWITVKKEAGSEIATACAGGSCDLFSMKRKK